MTAPSQAVLAAVDSVLSAVEARMLAPSATVAVRRDTSRAIAQTPRVRKVRKADTAAAVVDIRQVVNHGM